MTEQADVILAARRAIEQTRVLRDEVEDLRAQARASSENAETAVVENKQFARRMRWAIAFMLVWTVLAAYIAINLHEVYRTSCDPRLTGKPAAVWCNYVFFGDSNHDHL